jgi:hypothetical protein
MMMVMMDDDGLPLSFFWYARPIWPVQSIVSLLLLLLHLLLPINRSKWFI